MEKTLDAFSDFFTNQKKSNRGRKREMPWETVTGRASNYGFQLNEVWDKLGPALLAAQTEHEVSEVFEQSGQPYAGEFTPRLTSDILKLIGNAKFPQRRIPQIKFLARSLAGRPILSFRRSRDICEMEALREKLKSPYRILRREFFIECTCGYNGPALDNDCPRCGAHPQLSLHEWTGRAPEMPETKTKRKIDNAVQPEQEVATPTASNPSHALCWCGASIAAATRDLALEALAAHKCLVHGEAGKFQAEELE